MMRSSLFLLLLLTLTAASGCGYGHRSLYAEDVGTVAVPIFENRSFYRGVEFDLTEVLVKKIELDTPYKVAAPDTADTRLDGSIVSIEQVTLSRGADGGMAQDLEVRVTIDFTWKDLRSGRVLRERQGFEAVGRYIPAHAVGQSFETAQHEAVERLAQGIVSVMQADW